LCSARRAWVCGAAARLETPVLTPGCDPDLALEVGSCHLAADQLPRNPRQRRRLRRPVHPAARLVRRAGAAVRPRAAAPRILHSAVQGAALVRAAAAVSGQRLCALDALEGCLQAADCSTSHVCGVLELRHAPLQLGDLREGPTTQRDVEEVRVIPLGTRRAASGVSAGAEAGAGAGILAAVLRVFHPQSTVARLSHKHSSVFSSRFLSASPTPPPQKHKHTHTHLVLQRVALSLQPLRARLQGRTVRLRLLQRCHRHQLRRRLGRGRLELLLGTTNAQGASGVPAFYGNECGCPRVQLQGGRTDGA
jgi:hypothetical protein